MLINWTVVRDAEGRPLRTVANIQDTTERKRAETALRESQALNQAVLGSLASHIAVLDRDGNIIAVNEAWKRFERENGGAAIADSVGDELPGRLPPRSGAGDWRGGGGAEGHSGGAGRRASQFHNRISLPLAGREALVPDVGHPATRRRRGGAVVAHTDITKRKQVEESLRVSEKRLELAQKAGNIGTFDWDIRGLRPSGQMS